MLLGNLGNGFWTKASGTGSRFIRKKNQCQCKNMASSGNKIKVGCREVSSINKADLTLATNLKNWSVVVKRRTVKNVSRITSIGWCAWNNSCSQWPNISEVFYYTLTAEILENAVSEWWKNCHDLGSTLLPLWWISF